MRSLLFGYLRIKIAPVGHGTAPHFLGTTFSMSVSHVWTFQRNTLLGTTETIGPISEHELVSLAHQGKVTRDTLVSSVTRTKGGWHHAAQIAGLLKAMEEGELSRQATKATQQQVRDSQRRAAEEAKQAARSRQQADEAARASAAAEISDCQDPALVNTIRERVQGILTSSERLEYIIVQQKPLVNISPDAVVCTSRRLIFYRPKLLGRFEFEDYQWFDLFNAHLKQNFLGSVFSAQHVSGRWLSMDYLPKLSAQTLYRIAQEREEAARITRVNMQLDAARAGAANVNVQTHVPPPAPSSPAPSSSSSDDLLKRLETLKAMADRGLITPDEFTKRKQEILSQL